MVLDTTSNLFFFNTEANDYKYLISNTLVSNQRFFFSIRCNSYLTINEWSIGESSQPLLIQNILSVNDLCNNQVAYLNSSYRENRGITNDIVTYNDLLQNTTNPYERLIFSIGNPAFFKLNAFSIGSKNINIPSVQDYLLGTIDISFCSGPDGYNSNTVGILLDQNGNQFPIDNSGITYSNDSNSAADVMLYTRNTNEIYVRCKANSSCNGFYLYSTIFKVIRNPGRERLDIQLLDSSSVNFIPNNNLSSTNVSHAYISVTNIINYDVSSELQFSGPDTSYNYFVRENYFFIQADARCLSGDLYKSCLINLSTTPKRIGVISLA